MTDEPNVALYFLQALKEEGIGHVFLVPGYNIDNFVENYAQANIIAIVASHEGGAAFMADGYARASQRFGVCMGLAGPGVTNMVTAIAAAYADRSPVLVVTASLPPEWDGDGVFQDSAQAGIDDCEIMRPITVFSNRVRVSYKKIKVDGKSVPQFQLNPDYDKVGDFLQKALRAMGGFENRPAFLALPLEILNEPYKRTYQPLGSQSPIRAIDTHAAQTVPKLLAAGKRIAILAGNGCLRSAAGAAILKFAEEFSIPITTTLRAKGLVSEEHNLSCGFFGISGTLHANKLLSVGNPPDSTIPGADLLLVLGATLNENNTYGWGIKPPTLARVDINPNDTTGKNYPETFVTGDIKTFMEWLEANRTEYAEQLLASKPERESWLASIRATPRFHDPLNQTSNAIPIHPARVVTELREIAPRNTLLVVDSGAHSYHVPHHWQSYGPNEFLILTNTGPMGYGIALAIGAKMARPEQPCVTIVGDGSLLMHGTEIHTAVRYNIPLIVIMINNEALGNVYLRSIHSVPPWPDAAQQLTEISPRLDGVGFAKSLGADGILVQEPEQLAAAFTQAFEYIETHQRPFVVEVICCRDCQVPNSPYANYDEGSSERSSILTESMGEVEDRPSNSLRSFRYR